VLSSSCDLMFDDWDEGMAGQPKNSQSTYVD
jgi:hypothetical protein